MAIRLGLDAKIFFKTGGVGGEGTWTELTNVKDVTLNLETGEADISTRGGAGWELTVATLKSGTVEFEMVWNTGDAGFAAIKTAYFANEPIGLAVLDGPLASGEGLVADFSITNFTRNEPLAEAMTVNVTAKPTLVATPPEWVDDGVS